ncbi:hypothetical protein jhhlp_008731 [Lomentospora prolificans]|uniref:DNA repair protein rhp7 treble clef domain-containing protein n=1 Tax=Lomentospora prolificans TaxID=41688 RepID=A0A2N3MYU6_9PEZI|nr:hypothetical protein jhhlp_008731 [Lomentospora prolificans]
MAEQGNQGGANGQDTSQPGRGQGRRGRQASERENITGPRTALSDFLSTYNISSRHIRRNLQRQGPGRGRATRADSPPSGNENGSGDETANGDESNPSAPVANGQDGDGDEGEDEPLARPTRRAKKAASKKSTPVKKPSPPVKKPQKRKRSDDKSDAFSDGDDSVKDFMSMLRSRAGQVDHCELCLKKFTITPYTKTGPNGGLLCADCGRVMKGDKKPEPKKPLPKPKPSMKALGKRRQMKSQIMSGTFKIGAKSLTTLCVETLARNVDMVESLGDMAPHLVDKVAKRLSKRRLVDSGTLTLFLQPSTEELKIYDAAKLTEEDFISCFSICQNLRLLKFRNGIHFNDSVLSYLVSRHTTPEHISIHGSNLISDKAWVEFLAAKGTHLNTLKVHFTDKSFGEDVLAAVVKYCPQLKSLSLQHIARLSSKGIAILSGLKNIEHLSLQLNDKIIEGACEELVPHIGKNLKTLSFRRALNCNDDLLCAIHDTCRNLVKLRLTECSYFTDEGFANMFTGWANPALEYVDLSKCRHMDATEARNPESGIGFGSNALKALMSHSGELIRYLNLDSARYISAETFEEVFREGIVYPKLEYLEVSFCGTVTDYIIEGIFKACPALKELVVFGCMLVRGLVKVPRGKLLIGVPNVRGMIIEGEEDYF